MTGDLFASINAAKSKQPDAMKPKADNKGQELLLPDRHKQQDFFVLDLVDYAFKTDQASMESPIFSLSTKKDLSVWEWESEDKTKRIEVSPNAKYGRATQFDKDLWIYCTSQLIAALNEGKEINRVVRFTAYDFLVATNRSTGGDGYRKLEDALARLKGTTIVTNILTNGEKAIKGFGLIGEYSVVEKSPDAKAVTYEIELPKWLFNAIESKRELLTIHPQYFRLRKPLERRLYEIARKHVGKQGTWAIGLDALRAKTGSNLKLLRQFKQALITIIEANTLPEYQMQLDETTALVMFYSRDMKVTAKRLKVTKALPKK